MPDPEDYLDDWPTCDEAYASFRLFGVDVDPDAVTGVLGVEPSTSYRTGDPVGRASTRRKTNAWILSSEGAFESRDLRRHVDWLLDIVEPHAAYLAELLDAGADADVFCFWLSHSGQGGPELPPRLMERLARLRLDILFDVYFPETEELVAARNEAKADLHRYLQLARDALLWKLDGLSDYDLRRPLTPTGTNLLGIVKHVASVELGYFGATFGRPSDEPLPWFEEGAEDNADMWATPDESRDDIVGLYHRAWAHADATIEALPIDAVGSVAWWPEERRQVTLNRILVHMIAETNRHAGHADVVRELIDGRAGLRPDNDNLPPGADEAWWAAYRERVEQAAQHAAPGANT